MFCTNCGKKLENYYNYCTNCGTSVKKYTNKIDKKAVKKDNINDIVNDYIDYVLPPFYLIKNEKSKDFVTINTNLKHGYIPIGISDSGYITKDLDKISNILIGGTVASGKTTYINFLISSILINYKPNEVKLIIVDSKHIDYEQYNNIPHMLMSTIYSEHIFLSTLMLLSKEMDKRYDCLKKLKLTNIKNYNDTNNIKKWPRIIVIIDEYTYYSNNERITKYIENIVPYGYKVGIHLFLVVNRPSTDIIPSIVNSFFPDRIAFRTTTSRDSSLIINTKGAEKLIPPHEFLSNIKEKQIIKTPYICDEDIKELIDFAKAQKKNTNYNFIIENTVEAYDEPLYDDIVEFVISVGVASASLIQRRFKLGYNRSTRAIDLLEERGIIGPANGSKPRKVLIKNTYE